MTWIRVRQNGRTAKRVRQWNRTDRVRWHPDQYVGCSFTTYVPKSSDGYTLSELGLTWDGGLRIINNGYVKAGINGPESNTSQGTFGDGGLRGYGLLYDPTGNGNFDNTKDWLAPGAPWDAWAFVESGIITPQASDHPANFNANIGGSNDYWNSPTIIGGNPSQTARIAQLGTNHYIARYGEARTGIAVLQYAADIGQQGICCHMLWLNTTGSAKHMYGLRATDPDADNGYYPRSANTYNVRGWDNIDETDIVVAYASGVQQYLALRTSSTYEHNASIEYWWSHYDPVYMLNNKTPYYEIGSYLPGSDKYNDSDAALALSWDFGIVQPGEYVEVSCAYIFGSLADPDTLAGFGNPE